MTHDAMPAYGAPEDPLLPLGELARLLDLNITVSPAEGRVLGRIGQAERPITVDLATGVFRLAGTPIAMAPQPLTKPAASLSNSGRAHPPRSNPPLRSSSDPPSPCITPSTETCVRVVSFMVADPFSPGLVVVGLDRTSAPISSAVASHASYECLRRDPTATPGSSCEDLPACGDGVEICRHVCRISTGRVVSRLCARR